MWSCGKNKNIPLILYGIVVLSLSSCAGQSEPEGAVWMDSHGRDTWAYWLQNIELERLRNSSFDLVMIDYSRDGRDSSAFSRGEIGDLQAAGKKVFAYFSIGEAEDYRFYWKSDWETGSPSFIGEENSRWEGNYKVRYWESRWWDEAIEPYLQKILDAGYDGVYLDIVDAYYYWGRGDSEELNLMADRMVDLILRIYEYGNSFTGAAFSVCIQNGLAIVEAATEVKAENLLNTISHASLESLFFNTTAANRSYRLKLVEEFNDHGIILLNVEYIDGRRVDEYRDFLSRVSVPIRGLVADADRALATMPFPP